MNSSSTRTNTLPTKLRSERSMPKWVTEASDRIGPKPPAPPPATTNGGGGGVRPPALPPKKNQPEPDYEVIEFSNQQYSNEPTTTVMRPKTPDTRRPETAMKCTLCGSNNPWVTCDECAQQIFCASCDDMFHKHPKRKTHLRKAIEVKKGGVPLIPPKALTPSAPIAPPRRKKGMPSPMPLRRDQVIGSTATTPSASPQPGAQPQQPAWQDRLGSLKRGLNLSNRPLPETPRTPSDGISSRSTTPNSKSVFDQIQKPPSITLEKIKTKASATLDRMALLQQRYRQHKQSKQSMEKLNGQREQMLPSDQWSNISSPSQFRSGSMSSGINSFDYPDESSFQFNQPMSSMRAHGPSGRNMSSSVFNLNQMGQRHHRDQQSPMWMGGGGGGSQMQQAQSMAQLNCMSCHSHGNWNHSHQHPEDWPGAQNSNLNRSNMSLNVTHGYYPHNQHMMHAPPVFMNMPGMYPYPMGMPIPTMNPGMMGMPSTARSRQASRAGSRAPSPTHSRKSMQVRSKKRTDYSETELTDDEDSDNDDRRSLMSQRSGLTNSRRTRRVSSVSQALEQDEPRTFRSKGYSSRDRRGPSVAKSVQEDWTPARRPSVVSNANSNFNSYRKVYSDSPISPDSEASEAPPTRALVQAKIQEKMKESSQKPIPSVISDDEKPTQPIQPNVIKREEEKVEQQNGKQVEDPTDSNVEDTSSLGPPPSTPEHEWECEFCTFVNEPKTKICLICCKTPQTAPKKPILKPTTDTKASTTTTVTNGLAKLKVSQHTEDESEDSMAKKKDEEPIEDIWATLDENIQAEAKKAKRNAETAIEYKKSKERELVPTQNSSRASSVAQERKIQKVSTGCGPSPPKEIQQELRSTATSPVPQTISTQTYEDVPKKNEIKPLQVQTTSTETSTNMPQSEFQNQSFTPPTRNFSPKETYTSMMQEPPATSRDALDSLAYMDRARLYREMPNDRYRSSTDIRPSDLHSPRPQIPDYLSLQKEAEHYKFTAEELHAALKNCGDIHPIVWLRENWSKLVQTVQSLATKYGQERIENVIGTISAIEAREALRMHGGNVWQAISECIEQRQRKYLEISAKGNYSREDIVTALTAHHGNMDLALLDLSKTQLKPFLMRVWGSPGGVENESANYLPSTSSQQPAPKTEISSPIHEFLVANADQMAFTQDQTQFRNPSSLTYNETKDDFFYGSSQNKNVLKDLEILIGNMEQVQAKQSSQTYRSMEDMLGNLLAKKPQEAEMDSDAERIFMKSPIYSNRNVANGNSGFSNKSGGNDDVKNFVWQHIQEIVPNLVEQVERDLMEPSSSSPQHFEIEEAERLVEPPPIDADEFLMEEVIRPNLKYSTQEEEPAVAMEDVEVIEKLKVEEENGFFRKQKEEYELKSLEFASRQVFKMAVAPESSSEEESSEEESSEEGDSQEEVSSKDVIRNEESLVKSATIVRVAPQKPISVEPEEQNLPPEEQIPVSMEPEQVEDSQDNVPVTTEAPSDTPSTSTETKKEKSQGYVGYAFRFGFNGSRRNRKPRNRRSLKREKKKGESEVEEIGNQQKEEMEEIDTKSSSEKTEQNQVLIPNENGLEASRSEEINEQVSSQLEPPIEINIEPKENQTTDKKTNKIVKKRSNIPSSTRSKQLKNVEETPQKAQPNKEIVPTPQTAEIESTISMAEPSVSTAESSSVQSEPQETLNSEETNLKNSPIAPQKTSQLKKPKSRNIQKESKNLKTEDDQAAISSNSKTQDSPKTDLNTSHITLNSKTESEKITEDPSTSQQNKNDEPVSSSARKPTISKIPVRRTTSSTSVKSLGSTSNSITPTPTPTTESSTSPFNFDEPKSFAQDQKGFSTEDDEIYQDVQSSSSEDEPDETNFYNAIEDVVQPNVSSPPPAEPSQEEGEKEEEDDENSDQELYSIADSEEPHTLQSPTSDSEVLLILDNNNQSPAMPLTTITPVSSGKSIDFKYSDPSKQNLSELVEDTQRLIKQMKEEINIDMAAYDSEDDDEDDDEGDYSDDEYSYEEEYDEEEEYEDEEEEIENSDDFIEEEGSDEEYSNADIGIKEEPIKSTENENQEAAGLGNLQTVEEIQEQKTEELESLQNTPSTDHASLVVVVDTSSLINATPSPNTDSNMTSAVSDEPLEELKPSSPIPEQIREIVEQPSSNDNSIEKGLQQVESEMKNVLHSDNREPIVVVSNKNDNQPSTSNAVKPVKKDKAVKQALNTVSQKNKSKTPPNAQKEKSRPNEEKRPIIDESLPSTSTVAQENVAKSPTLSTSVSEKKQEIEHPIKAEQPHIDLQQPQATSEYSSALENHETTDEPHTDLPQPQSNSESSSTLENHEVTEERQTDLQRELNSESSTTSENQAATEAPSSSISPRGDSQNDFDQKTNEDSGHLQTNQTSSDSSPIVTPLKDEPTTNLLDEPSTSSPMEPSTSKDQNKRNAQIFSDTTLSTIKTTSPPRKSPPTKIASKIPKPKIIPNQKPAPIPTRSKSFSAPSPSLSPIGVSSVRAIQQELFKKQTQLAKAAQASLLPKTSPPKLVRKKSITDAISKFTQATAEHTIQRSRTQPKIPKIPKKKYHETCFSDDEYQGSSSEEEVQPQPVESRLRKQSAPVFRTYASIVELQVEEPEICVKRLIDEKLVSNMAEAQIAAALVGMRFQQDVSIWAAKQCCDLDQAIALLQQDCELCMGSYPLNQIVTMLKCTHKCCKQCAKNYFTIQITDRSINDCNCPFCKTPELNDPNAIEDENLEYFSNLDIFIKNIVEPEVHELFQRKLRDRTLMQDPNFRWCIQCSSGFFARPKQKRLICPDCGSVTCSQCRKTWEKQHEGLTCEKFQEWKEANDPEIQAKGVAEHLALNGIDCPKCRFRYSLARGGCMHFTCTQCKFEFCYGCGKPFMMGAKCTVSPYCSKLGLHSHHPRSCLFYLRDKEPHTLQNLLLANDVSFDVDPIVFEGPSTSTSTSAPATSVFARCPIPLQKETPKGLVDTVCNNDVVKDQAGLCRQHYVEYLAGKVYKANIDPLPILDLTDCVQELRRRGLPLPERGPWDTDEIYRDMCSKVIKEKIPL